MNKENRYKTKLDNLEKFLIKRLDHLEKRKTETLLNLGELVARQKVKPQEYSNIVNKAIMDLVSAVSNFDFESMIYQQILDSITEQSHNV